MIQGMSTRKGTSVFLEQILDEAKDTMHEQMQKTADKYAQIEDPIYTSDVLGMSAVKIQVCRPKYTTRSLSYRYGGAFTGHVSETDKQL